MSNRIINAKGVQGSTEDEISLLDILIFLRGAWKTIGLMGLIGLVVSGVDNKVLRTTEKRRISDLCSNGLYGFARCGDYKNAYADYIKKGDNVNGEIYIAPLYNFLIKDGHDIRYILVDNCNIQHCGIPADYENLSADYF